MVIHIRLKRNLRHLIYLLLVLMLSGGCSSKLSPKVRQQQADHFAEVGNLVYERITTDNFLLTTYQRFNHKDKSKQLVVYIEGDGMAWITRNQLSNNPTPLRPVALELASLDRGVNILYIARPCQYLWPQSMSNCSSEYWNDKRGSEEVIMAINQVISIIKAREGFLTIKIIGYSGGGGIAAIITERRDDVEKLITIAGNLNYDLFTKIHNLTPMSGSINPITIAKQITSTPQIHYVGGEDKIVPEQIVRTFSDKVVVVKGVTHASWAEKWREIISEVFP
jgi:hypothetical protein